MSHHSSSVNGEGTSHKDPLSKILDELSSLKLWKAKQERKEKGKKRKRNQIQHSKVQSFDMRTMFDCSCVCVCTVRKNVPLG